MNKEQRLVKRHSSRVAFLVYLSPRKARAIIDQLYLEVDERNEEISDGLQKLGLFGYLPDIVLYSPEYCSGDTKVVGYAHTVKMIPHDPSVAPLPQHHVDCAKEGDIIVISSPKGINAVWGGLMSSRAQYLGVKAVVIDGRVRDLSEQRELKFPVFARGQSTLGTGKYVQVAAINEPITIETVSINKCDIVFGDVDGVVTFPAAKLEELLKVIAEGVEADSKCMEDIKKGKTIKQAFAEHRGKK